MIDFKGYEWVFLAGAKVTLLVGLSAVPVALLLGLLGAWGKLAGNPLARASPASTRRSCAACPNWC